MLKHSCQNVRKVPQKLYSLFKSLTPTEKSDFRHWLSCKNEHLYALFSVFEQQVQPNSSEYKGSFTEVSINETEALLIFEALLEFLEAFSASPEIRLNRQLSQIQLLFERKQFDLCRQLILKAKAMAEQHYLLQDLEKVLVFEKKLLDYQTTVSGLTDTRSLYYNQTQLYEQLTNLYSYKELWVKVTNWGHVASVRTDRIKWLSHLLKHPLLQTEKAAYSFNAQILFHLIKAEIYKNLDCFDDAFQHTKSLLQLFYQNADYAEMEWSSFLEALNSHAMMAIQLGKYDDALMTSDFMKQMSGIYAFIDTHNLKCDIAVRYHLIDLKLCKETLQLNGIDTVIDTVQQCLQQSVVPVDYFYALSILTEIAQIHFLTANYKAAEETCQQIYNLEQFCSNVPLQTWAKMLHALALLETGQTEALQQLSGFIQSYFKEMQIYLRFETLFLDMLKKLAQPGKGVNYMLSILQDYEILFDSVRAHSEEYIHSLIIAWINSKLLRQPLLQFMNDRLTASGKINRNLVKKAIAALPEKNGTAIYPGNSF
ncbi:hypothetical protein C7N43_17440 [Sphingobacteriales bacterium UPWRP_1]|nr:hypothetical protein BVG80_04170 [Sphingobacteriales bacterium TSM_CSM]PSJ75749.1 hypothetical protein C7N43_17440 [Sphingobacteriales bacterium UPWRP_1]